MPPTSKVRRPRGAKASKSKANAPAKTVKTKPASPDEEPAKGTTSSKRTTSTRSKKRQQISTDEDESSNDEPEPRQPKKKTRKRQTSSDEASFSADETSDDDEKAESSDDDDEEYIQPKAKKAQKAKKARTAADETSDDDEKAEFSDDDDEEYIQPKAKTTKAKKAQKAKKARTAKKNVKAQQANSEPTKKQPNPKAQVGPIAGIVKAQFHGQGASVHPALVDAWEVNPKMLSKMHFIFDARPPYVGYKRGVKFDPEKDLPVRGTDTPSDLTDSQGDGGDGEWMSYVPRKRTNRWFVACSMTSRTFLQWEPGELRPFRLGARWENVKWTDHAILAPYDHIIAQLVAEATIGVTHDTHESRRRLDYAIDMLDAFADEIVSFKGDISRFYSKVLTHFLCDGHKRATIEHAIAFYLRMDPTDPKYIPIYRRQLLNVPIPRWHAAVTMNVVSLSGRSAGIHYDRFHTDHDVIMKSLLTAPYKQLDNNRLPLLNKTEVAVLIATRLDGMFAQELTMAIPNQGDLQELIRKYREDAVDLGDTVNEAVTEPIPVPAAIQLPPISYPPIRPNDRDLPGETQRAGSASQPQLETHVDGSTGGVTGSGTPQLPASPIPPPHSIMDQTHPQEAGSTDTAMGDIAGVGTLQPNTASPNIPAVSHRVDDAAQPREAGLDVEMGDIAGPGASQPGTTSPDPLVGGGGVAKVTKHRETGPDVEMGDIADADTDQAATTSPDIAQPHEAGPDLETSNTTGAGTSQPEALADRPADASRSIPPSPSVPATFLPSPAASRHVTPTAQYSDDMPATSQLNEESISTTLQWMTDRSLVDDVETDRSFVDPAEFA